MPTYTWTTDFGAVGNGVTDNAAACAAWLAAATANPGSTLIVPAGSYVCSAVPGIATLAVDATIIAPSGATIDNLNFVGPANCFPGDNSLSGFIAQANIGDTSVTLLTVGDASKFFVGQWIVVTGVELQPSGYPPAWQRLEWRQITGVNAVTGVISFTSALTQAYSTTWPNVNRPDAAHPTDQNNFGGPAMIAGTLAGWNCSVVVDGFTITSASGGGNSTGRNPIVRNCSWTTSGALPVAPTACLTATFDTCYLGDNFTSGVEIDKVIDTAQYIACTGSTGLFMATSALNNLVVTNCNLGFILGQGQSTTITNTTLFNYVVGPNGYGRVKSLTVSGLTITSSFKLAGTFIDKTLCTYIGAVAGHGNGGVYRASVGSDQIYAAAVPGFKYAFYYVANRTITPDSGSAVTFCITDMWQDATYVYFQTDMIGAEPTPTFGGGHAADGFYSYPLTSLTGTATGADITQGQIDGTGTLIATVAPGAACAATIGPVTPPVVVDRKKYHHFHV